MIPAPAAAVLRVDLRALLAKLNPLCTQALQSACGSCLTRGHCEVTACHLALELLRDGRGDWPGLLAAQGLDAGAVVRALEAFLEGCPRGHAGKPVFAPALVDLLQDAWLAASVDLGQSQLRSGAILAALLARLALEPPGGPLEALRGLGRDRLLQGFESDTGASLETAAVAPAAGGFLDRFCRDFTRAARDGAIDPVFGRDQEIRQIIDILARRRKNNPILVGDPGVGKTAVVEGLALRIVQGEVPVFLREVALLGLDLGLLEAGAGLKGEFESRLKGVLQEIEASPRPVLLFVDEAHALVGAGGAAGGSDAANLLKPALARGASRTLAATTWSEYKKYFERDPALARRFQPVRLQAPSVADTVQILRGIRPHYEQAHGVFIRDDALAAAAELADKYMAGRHLPDSAIDLLDTSCARVKVDLGAQPRAVEAAARAVQALEREMAALDRDRAQGAPVPAERLEALPGLLGEARAAATDLDRRWREERQAVQALLAAPDLAEPEQASARGRLAAVQDGRGLLRHEVDPEGVAQVVSDWTGVPLGRLLRDEATVILDLEARLGGRIQGQEPALRSIAERLRSAKAGLRNPAQPLGVFLAVGPSGVGKTATAQALAEILFGSERSLVSLNMTEFQESHSLSRLVGSPPGYVGYGEGGRLTEAVRQRPYAVVLLDEVEKAHPDVVNLFHQVFDQGTLTDGEGKEVDFRNTVLILTSNLGAGIIQERAGADARTLVEALRPALARQFQPALLARMTVVPFLPLRREAMAGIVRAKLDRVRATLWASQGIRLTVTAAAEAAMAARCADPHNGARAVDFLLDGEVLPALAREILARLGGAPERAAALDAGGAGDLLFTFQD